MSKCKYCGGMWETEDEYVDVGIGSICVASTEIPCCWRSEIAANIRETSGEEPDTQVVWQQWQKDVLEHSEWYTVRYYQVDYDDLPF